MATSSKGKDPEGDGMSQEALENAARWLVGNRAAMDFARREALEKVASEIRELRKSGTTAKAVEILEIRHPNIRKRVLEYTAAGLVGIALAVSK